MIFLDDVFSLLDGKIPQTPLVNKFLNLQVDSQKKMKKNDAPKLNLINQFDNQQDNQMNYINQ